MFHEAFHIACYGASPAFMRVEMRHRRLGEVLANHFATCVLMPKEWVEEQWPMVQDIDRMADIFDVSTTRMRRRLSQLSLLEGTMNPVGAVTRAKARLTVPVSFLKPD